MMGTKLGPAGTANTILFVENSGHITNAIVADFATYGDDNGSGNATEAQKQVYIYNRVIDDPEGFGTTISGIAMLPKINMLITPIISQAMVALCAGDSMQDGSGNNILTEALSHDALRVLLGLIRITHDMSGVGEALVAIARHPNLTDAELPALTTAIQSCANYLDFDQYVSILTVPVINTNTANAIELIRKCGCIKPLTCYFCDKGC